MPPAKPAATSDEQICIVLSQYLRDHSEPAWHVSTHGHYVSVHTNSYTALRIEANAGRFRMLRMRSDYRCEEVVPYDHPDSLELVLKFVREERWT